VSAVGREYADLLIRLPNCGKNRPGVPIIKITSGFQRRVV